MQFYTQKPHDNKQNIVSYITKHTYITANLAIYCAACPRLPGTAQISSFTFAEMGDSLTFSQPARPFSYLLLRNYAEEWYLLMNCSGQPIPEHNRLNRSVLRMYDEEQLSKHHPLPLDSLIPALITFDIFSEKADWRWIM